jgi:cytochrome c peroxidase
VLAETAGKGDVAELSGELRGVELALISKQWAHMNRFKVPSLRDLSNRPPYFHDGSASSLEATVAHHDQRFGIGLSMDEKAALVAFLSAL